MLGWLVLHFAIGFTGTWLARRYAVHRDLLDHPGERRSHATPTPRGGGIAIVLALLVAACVLAWRQPQQIVLIGAFVAGLLLVAGVGLVDDHRPLSPWLRLGVQFAAACALALGAAGAWGDLRIALLAFAAVMVLSNVWNFMDGINGIAASQAVLVAAWLGLAAGGVWGVMAMALVAACLGFLPFNFPNARIFLGDVGSGALGFALAALLAAAAARQSVEWPVLVLPFSAFLVDSGMTLMRRILRGERWWAPHAQHAYQRWSARLGTHTPVTLAYAGWTAVACWFAWWLQARGEGQAGSLSAAWWLVTTALWGWLQYVGNREAARLATHVKKDKE